jgi:hypothetical protein
MAIESHRDEKLQSPAVATRPVLLSGLGALLLLAGAIGVLAAIYSRQVSMQHYPAPEEFPQPRVQTGQKEQLQRLEAEQRKRLTEYRWVDRTQGIVQIPIERAMEILAGEGMQAYAPLSSPTAGAERLIAPENGAPPGAVPAGSGDTGKATEGQRP